MTQNFELTGNLPELRENVIVPNSVEPSSEKKPQHFAEGGAKRKKIYCKAGRF